MSLNSASPAPDRRESASLDDKQLRYKRELHQKLIASMDLSVLSKSDPEELRREVRIAAAELCRRSTDLLNLPELPK